MCGIAGWITLRQNSAGPAALTAMTDAVRHRGPDDAGQEIVPVAGGKWQLALGFRRLSIIDLTTGHQPMKTPDGRLTVIFNGEIYNYVELREELRALGHVFETTSDTEVLLHAFRAWDLACLKRLRGMFAFALWDEQTGRLIVARDPFGKKPVYLTERNGKEGTGLIFGSEINALLAHPEVHAALDEASLYHYLVNRYVPGPQTLFENIRKLRPGCALVWEEGRIGEHRYWSPPDGEAPRNTPEPDDPVAAFMSIFDEAVQIRMRSDVPFGAFLSGGLDSSAVVATMARHSNRPINTFSVGFREAAFSELGEASLVARTFGCNHNELVVTARDVIDYLPRLVGFRGAPVSEPADVPIYLMAREAARQVKMVLTGEGSDELLGGYPKHRFERFMRAYHRLVPGPIHDALIRPLGDRLPYGQRRIKILLGSAGERDFVHRMQRWMGAMSGAERDRLWGRVRPSRSLDAYPFTTGQGVSDLRRILYFDQTSWLPDNLLERGDRMTMAASLEARMPFMDTELAEFMSGLADGWRIRKGTSKYILRRAMADILPPEILGKPKVGFRLPINEWFRTSLKDYVSDHLTGPGSRIRTRLDAGILERIVDEHVSGRQNHEKTIWMLVNLELFLRHYRL